MRIPTFLVRGAILCAIACCAGPAQAQVFESLGSRALGMGGVFVAVADDGSAVYWNPAGLATGPLMNVQLEWTPFEAGDDERDLATPLRSGSGALVALTFPAAGVAYYRLRDTAVTRVTDERFAPEAELSSLVTHHTGLTLVQSLGQWVDVAGSFKFVRGVAANEPRLLRTGEDLLEQAEDLVGRATNRFDLDIGVLARAGRARLGLVARNLTRPAFEANDGTELRLDRQVRAGLAFGVTPQLIVAADADLTRTDTRRGERRNVAAGAEWWSPGGGLGVRAGFRASTLDDVRPAATAGVSYAVRSALWLDAHIVRGGDEADRGWGLGVRVGF